MKTKLINVVLLASTLGFAGVSNASTITYNLESNNLTGSYGTLATVTLQDTTDSHGTGVMITVDSTGAADAVTSLGFNLLGNTVTLDCATTSAGNCESSLDSNYNGPWAYDGSGKYADQFDMSSSAPRPSSFSFTLYGFGTGDFTTNSYGNLFATHVYLADGSQTGFAFGGTEVPLPAAAWLFGTGLLGLVGVARRKKSA